MSGQLAIQYMVCAHCGREWYRTVIQERTGKPLPPPITLNVTCAGGPAHTDDMEGWHRSLPDDARSPARRKK